MKLIIDTEIENTNKNGEVIAKGYLVALSGEERELDRFHRTVCSFSKKMTFNEDDWISVVDGKEIIEYFYTYNNEDSYKRFKNAYSKFE